MPTPRNEKPVAKSLHTLTVLVQVAGLIRTGGMDAAQMSHEEAMRAAMVELGLANRPDPYGLKARALALLLAKEA